MDVMILINALTALQTDTLNKINVNQSTVDERPPTDSNSRLIRPTMSASAKFEINAMRRLPINLINQYPVNVKKTATHDHNLVCLMIITTKKQRVWFGFRFRLSY